MVRTYHRKTSRGSHSDVLQRAAEEVIANKESYRTAALAFGVDKMTLYRHVQKIKKKVSEGTNNDSSLVPSTVHIQAGYARARQVFGDHEEAELVTYLTEASKMFFGLSAKETRKLAYEFAINLGKSVPGNWTSNVSAGPDWFSGFMKRHKDVLSVRTPEATSLSRMTSFNRTNVNMFYDNLEDLYRRFHFEPQCV